MSKPQSGGVCVLWMLLDLTIFISSVLGNLIDLLGIHLLYIPFLWDVKPRHRFNRLIGADTILSFPPIICGIEFLHLCQFFCAPSLLSCMFGIHLLAYISSRFLGFKRVMAIIHRHRPRGTIMIRLNHTIPEYMIIIVCLQRPNQIVLQTLSLCMSVPLLRLSSRDLWYKSDFDKIWHPELGRFNELL